MRLTAPIPRPDRTITNSQRKPPVSWNGQTDTFTIRLNGLKGRRDGKNVEAKWTPPVTYVVRIREVGSSEWSYGFETPLTGCRFVGLKPDTEYEVALRSKNAHGESRPALIRHRTDSPPPTDPMAVWVSDDDLMAGLSSWTRAAFPRPGDRRQPGVDVFKFPIPDAHHGHGLDHMSSKAFFVVFVHCQTGSAKRSES